MYATACPARVTSLKGAGASTSRPAATADPIVVGTDEVDSLAIVQRRQRFQIGDVSQARFQRFAGLRQRGEAEVGQRRDRVQALATVQPTVSRDHHLIGAAPGSPQRLDENARAQPMTAVGNRSGHRSNTRTCTLRRRITASRVRKPAWAWIPVPLLVLQITRRLSRFFGSNSRGHSLVRSPPAGRKIALSAVRRAGHSSSDTARGGGGEDTGLKDTRRAMSHSFPQRLLLVSRHGSTRFSRCGSAFRGPLFLSLALSGDGPRPRPRDFPRAGWAERLHHRQLARR